MRNLPFPSPFFLLPKFCNVSYFFKYLCGAAHFIDELHEKPVKILFFR